MRTIYPSCPYLHRKVVRQVMTWEGAVSNLCAVFDIHYRVFKKHLFSIGGHRTRIALRMASLDRIRVRHLAFVFTCPLTPILWGLVAILLDLVQLRFAIESHHIQQFL